jgi:chromosome segregation ATPase
LGREFEEASMSSSARQIELVARESEINRLVSDISTLKGQRRSADRISRDADGRVKVAEGDVAVERRRAEQLNAKVLQLLSTLSDREERLERREREIVRLRERLRPLLTAPSDEQHDLRLADLATENVRLEAELADLMEQIGRDAPPRNTRASKANQQATQNLREQMADIAARIVHMTALLEGARFPLNDLLEKAGAKKTKAGKEISLADRIRELQSAADGALSE